MSFPTQPACVMHTSSWEPRVLQHPMMRFIKSHADAFQAPPHTPSPKYYRDDFLYSESNGKQYVGYASAGEAMRKPYALFESFYHEPTYGVVNENEDATGWILYGYTKLFVNFRGGEEDDRAVEDAQGRKWDCVAHASFIFEAVADEDGVEGLKFKSSRNFVDPTGFRREAVKRGLIPAEKLQHK